ncbi:nucleotidyl transferase AbiEii/AbiGii toxin family protein [Rathayibacter soli]|uniref:nucleotidyl transferase AbiEii/AbiGii toxin family protein n=1 Tax=Rathayibacter soli TaxID=3144168 RepID=UPI0027E42052|nr:nucleotidyl transferase AbiEii/AbiGii toxin family protein [Glaciibacter superstes]
MNDLEYQRRVAFVLLEAIGDAGFALAGSSAIREHGLTDRPTEDVDLFTDSATTAEQFQTALRRGENALQTAGYRVERIRSFPLFARIRVEDTAGTSLDVDFAVNWRRDAPVRLSLGPVVSERDAVAGKLSAVYSRAEVRDFLDLDAIRRSGRYADTDLLAMGREHDDGFDETMFAQQLSRVANVLPSEAEEYGTTAEQLAGVQQRIMSWAIALREAHTPPAPSRSTIAKRIRQQQLDARQRALGEADPIPPERPGREPPHPSL